MDVTLLIKILWWNPKEKKTSSLPKVTTFIKSVVTLQYCREFNFHWIDRTNSRTSVFAKGNIGSKEHILSLVWTIDSKGHVDIINEIYIHVSCLLSPPFHAICFISFQLRGKLLGGAFVEGFWWGNKPLQGVEERWSQGEGHLKWWLIVYKESWACRSIHEFSRSLCCGESEKKLEVGLSVVSITWVFSSLLLDFCTQ